MSAINAHSLSKHRDPALRRAASGSAKTRWRLNAALLRAAGDGDVALIQSLIRSGANVNFRNRQGETPLSFAAAWDQLATAKLLLAHKADANLADATGGTALMLAAQHGSKQLVRELLCHGANPTDRDKAGHTVLMHADWRTRADDGVKQLILKALSGRRT